MIGSPTSPSFGVPSPPEATEAMLELLELRELRTRAVCTKLLPTDITPCSNCFFRVSTSSQTTATSPLHTSQKSGSYLSLHNKKDSFQIIEYEVGNSNTRDKSLENHV
jgi:hypothetical protein